MNKYVVLIIYIASISLISVFLTISDKIKAKKGSWRIKESTLLTVAAFGGAAAMYICMKKIRHKTKKARFMISLPLMFATHIITFVLLFKYVF